jgi:hypothetical protein
MLQGNNSCRRVGLNLKGLRILSTTVTLIWSHSVVTSPPTRILPKRIELGPPLNPYDRNTLWGGDHCGYSAIPFYEELENTGA